MDIETRLELSYYKEIAPINEEHRIFLVRNTNTGKIYVKKTLSIYNKDIYQSLKDNPIDGIPRLFLLYEEDNELTIIEEYVSGSTIEELLRDKGAFDEATTVNIISELCDILSAIHSRKPAIVHRDIKPSNVMVAPNGHIYLLDLNAARAGVSKSEDTELLGTQGYAAPEQYGFGSSTVRTDIYAIGMLMNTMLWGSFNREIFSSVRLAPIIKCCLQIKPEDRYRNTMQIKKSLAEGQEKNYLPNNVWRKFIPPGFRSRKIAHMIIATIVYVLTGYLCFSLKVKETYGAELYFERFMCFLIFFGFVACTFNYLDMQRLIPLCKHRKLPVRIIGITLLNLCTFVVLFFIMFYIDSVVFK